MFIEQIPVIFRFQRGIKWRFSHFEKKIYLTFDDGPIPEVTPWVLDVLDKYHIKATFFCVGENVERYPEIYRDILRRGHHTGNHTYNHANGLKYGKGEYMDNVNKAAELIKSDLFRPPHGALSYAQYKMVRRNNYRIVLWDVITRDYNAALCPQKVFEIVRRYVRNGSIIVFHDSLKSQKNMCSALPQAIEYCLAKGYSFELL